MKHNYSIYTVLLAGVLLTFVFSCSKETQETIPTVTIADVTSITATTATCNGEITDDGGTLIAARGFCWSTKQNPTTGDNTDVNGTGSGSFSSTINGLKPGATYYIKAYAINVMGKSYSSQTSFTALALVPVLTTLSATSITATSFMCGGNVTDDGGSAVKARGICWSTHQGPTITDSIRINGLGLGSYSSSITGLSAGVIYYVRSYAINNTGTAYGNEIAVSTSPTVPLITTSSVLAITTTTASTGGFITADGGSLITARGVCWSINQNPTTADSKTIDGVGTSNFTSSITGLTPGTTYYIRAYATNSIGTAYGNQLTSTTTAVLPTLTTTVASAVTATTAKSGGNITNDGGALITIRGVCWSTAQNPTVADSKTTDGFGAGSYTGSLSGMTPGTTYYIRAYATNSVGTAYGNQVNTNTTPVIPTLTTSSILASTPNTASSGGAITSDGGASITSRGVCWSTNQNPTIADSKTSDGTGTTSFTSSITGLTPGATYYIRAYATNSIGTGYGNTVTKTTTAVVPTLTTTIATDITSTSTTSGGEITNDGGAPVTVRGICWSTSPNPTTASSTTNEGTGSGSFTSYITGLNPGASYYIRAYATNSVGTVYGNQETTTTISYLPTISTTDVLALTSTSATSGGVVTSNGGSAITASGVCWSITSNPTISSFKTTDVLVSGSFTSSITGLLPGTTYYIRAYATNSIGTVYGNRITITTTAVAPLITTTSVSGLTATGATSGGNITSDGGDPVTARGVCWSATQNPTITNSKTTDGTGEGSFISTISGLTPGTSYYIRAYATNSIGTSYGSQVTTSTGVTSPTLTTSITTLATSTTATSGGNITSDGGSAIISRGVCWGTSQNPSILNNKTSDGTGTGSFTSSVTGLLPGTTYYFRAYAMNINGTSYGNQTTIIVAATSPTISATSTPTVFTTSVTAGGNITADGGATVTARGVCWGTSTAPTISNSKTADGTGIGTFTSNITGLTANTTYYLRAYATNSAGTVYGTQIMVVTLPSGYLTVTDIDGNVYHTVTIGSQVWMVEELKTTHYRNGDPIATTTPASLDIFAQSGPKYQWTYVLPSGNQGASYFGKLYTWYAATDSRGVCPIGYHVPTDAEWTTLTTFLGGEAVAGGKLKDTDTTLLWLGPNTGATNSSKFYASPTGFRNYDGVFDGQYRLGYWWTSSEYSSSDAYYRRLYYTQTYITRSSYYKNNGFAIRCIRD